MMYAMGLGVERDDIKAYAHCSLAAAAGDSLGKRRTRQPGKFDDARPDRRSPAAREGMER